MFNEQNINELIKDRETDTTSFKSLLVPNKHVQPETLLQTIYQRDISDKNSGQVESGFDRSREGVVG